VIDDCSPDTSIEVLRRYESHPKVRLVLREENGGWVTVSNQGLEMSLGEYIIFANCDDDCDPHMIARLVKSLKRNPTAGIAFCRSLMIDKEGQIIGDDLRVRERSFQEKCATDTLITRIEMSRFLLHSCVIPNLSAALIRKRCFDRVGPLSREYRACSDWEFFFRATREFDFAYVAEPLNKFRQHEATIRSVTIGRVTYEEFMRLLLGQIRTLNLTVAERCRFRTHVMYLWAMHLMSPSLSGLRNFPYHLKRVLCLDPLALMFLVPGIAIRLIRILGKPVAGLLLSREKLVTKL
jgi:glycosyltransferase involved in cell wall biosynthesis